MKWNHWFYGAIVFTLCACAAPKNDDTGSSISGASNLNEEDQFESMDDEGSADDSEENAPQDTNEQDESDGQSPDGTDETSEDSDDSESTDDDPDPSEEESSEGTDDEPDEESDAPIEDTESPDVDSASGTTIVEATEIPATLPPRGTSGTLTVLSEMAPAGIIEDIVFSISLEHTCTKDLTATLTSPTGISAVVFDLTSRPVCSSDMDATSLSDEATTPISSGTTPFVGSHKPTEPLSVFDGENAAGQWTLTIVDETVGDTGTLVYWSLEIQLD